MSLEEKIIEALQDNILDTLSISKLVMGKNGTKAQVNPTLYSMEKRKLLEHVQVGNSHLWKVHVI